MTTTNPANTPPIEVNPPANSDRPQAGLLATELAELPERTILDKKNLARILGVDERTIQRMVSRFELPPPVRFAGKATWEAGKILSWFETRAERLARQAEQADQTFRRMT